MSCRTNDAEYYRRQYEALQDQISMDREREYERQERQRRERQEELRERRQAYETTADNWPEAFSKGIARAQREANQEAHDNAEIDNKPEWEDMRSTFFADWVKELKRGEQIYREEYDTAQHKIERLERMILAVKHSILLKAAERLSGEIENSGLAQAFQDDDLSYLVNW